MEELSFFNEREAECFEREDTLSLSDLEKLNVDENMPEMERVEKLLKTGLDKQKISIFNTIPKILANNNSKENLSLLLNCMKEVWQKYESELNANSAVLSELFRALASLSCTTVDGKALRFPKVTFHEEYAQQLEACLEEKKNAVFLLSEEQVIKLLVPFALDIIAEIQQKDQAEEASLALVALLPRVGTAIKKTQILRLAMEKGDVSQTPGSRLICCFVLGAVTALNLVAAPDIEGLYFQKMMSLCQDTDAEVRKCMCIQLDGLARAIGEDFARKELLSELLELLKDEEEQVKQAAFMTLLSLVDFFSPRDCIKQIIPELICIAESIPAYLVPCLAERYGQLVTRLASLNYLGKDTGQVFLQGYSRLCYHEEFETRQFCAYNFPAIVKVFGSAYASMLMDDLLLRLASDSSDEVRQHIAAGMHEVAVLIGQQQAMRYLKESALNLINDNSPIVQGMAISKLPSLLSAMIDPGDEEQKTLIMELVIKSVIEYHAILPSSRNREQLVLLETLQNFRPWISATQSYEMVVPIILALLENGARPVQVLALKVLLKYIRNDNNVSHRTSLLSRLRTEYGQGKSYWRRILYLDACFYALNVNSRLYCQRNFFEVAFDLLGDPVANVRIKAILLLPMWKIALSYLPDRKFVDRIGQFLDESKTDRDRDVANTLQEIRQAVEANNCGHKRRLQDDIDDKRKLSEEELLGLMKDHEESLVDSRWSTMLEYTLFVGTDGQVNRRARVKSFDLVNKFVKLPGKDTGRNAMNVNGNIGGVYNIGSKPDPTKIKASSAKALNKAAPSATTLPNCASARAGLAKMPLAAKVTNLGRSITVGTRSNTGLIRAGVGLSKDTGGITKIPIIRPSAPAKREASPSTSLKPTSATMVPTSGLSSRSGSIDCGVGPTKPQKNVGTVGPTKR
ncbi:putative serine/threonine-protein phosphatase 4 regulatory subunit 4 [Plasmopara halstedii]